MATPNQTQLLPAKVLAQSRASTFTQLLSLLSPLYNPVCAGTSSLISAILIHRIEKWKWNKTLKKYYFQPLNNKQTLRQSLLISILLPIKSIIHNIYLPTPTPSPSPTTPTTPSPSPSPPTAASLVSTILPINSALICCLNALDFVTRIPYQFQRSYGDYQKKLKDERVLKKYCRDFGYWYWVKLWEFRNPGGLVHYLHVVFRNILSITLFDTSMATLRTHSQWPLRSQILISLSLSTASTILVMSKISPYLLLMHKLKINGYSFIYCKNQAQIKSVRYVDIIKNIKQEMLKKQAQEQKYMYAFYKLQNNFYKFKIFFSKNLQIGVTLALYEYFKNNTTNRD